MMKIIDYDIYNNIKHPVEVDTHEEFASHVEGLDYTPDHPKDWFKLNVLDSFILFAKLNFTEHVENPDDFESTLGKVDTTEGMYTWDEMGPITVIPQEELKGKLHLI